MDKKWKTVISAKNGLFQFNFREVWEYRDLCFMFIRKNYITKYKQTVLGPIYMLLSPLLTSGIFSVVFGMIAGISTDGVPQFLFYMLGNLCWSFFSGCYGENSNIFGGNAYIMGKVYFPRLVVPISNILTRMINLSIQVLLFIGIYIIYAANGMPFVWNPLMLAVPILFFMLGAIGVGVGMIISSLTIKYRDMSVMMGFAMSLLFYATPVIYPLSNLTGVWHTIALFNPVAPLIEAIRFALFGIGTLEPLFLLYSFIVMLLVDFIGLTIFNRVERTFIDTV